MHPLSVHIIHHGDILKDVHAESPMSLTGTADGTNSRTLICREASCSNYRPRIFCELRCAPQPIKKASVTVVLIDGDRAKGTPWHVFPEQLSTIRTPDR